MEALRMQLCVHRVILVSAVMCLVEPDRVFLVQPDGVFLVEPDGVFLVNPD